jgi:hypothetical protein
MPEKNQPRNQRMEGDVNGKAADGSFLGCLGPLACVKSGEKSAVREARAEERAEGRSSDEPAPAAAA